MRQDNLAYVEDYDDDLTEVSTPFSNAYTISGINWDFENGFKFHYGIKEREFVQEYIEKNIHLPLSDDYKYKIRFMDNVWDFRPIFKNTNSDQYRFSFASVPEAFAVDARLYVLLRLLHSEAKLTTIFRRFADIKSFYNFLNQNRIVSAKHINQKAIDDFLQTKSKLAAETKHSLLVALRDLVIFYDANYSFQLDVDFDKLHRQTLKASSTAKANASSGKTPNIPEEFFIKFVDLMKNILSDSREKYCYRIAAGIYLLMSQTGLRSSEICTLKCDCLVKEKSYDLNNPDFYFLKTNIFKTSGKNQKPKDHKTFVTEETIDAIKTLLNIRPSYSESGEDYLFIPDNCTSFPITIRYPRLQLRYWLEKNQPSFLMAETNNWKGIPIIKGILNNSLTFYLPSNPQFRVHTITKLINLGIDLEWIQEFMGHLTPEMTSYYYRSDNNKTLETEAIQKLHQELHSGQVKLINTIKDDISNSIENTPLEKRTFRIVQDKFGLIEQNDNITFSAKHGGFCGKVGKARCSEDPYGHESMCAFGRCSNMHYVYFFANVIYQDFQNLQHAVELNYNNGMWLEAQRQLLNLKDLCQRALSPVLADLKKHMDQEGVKSLLERHPNVSEVVMNYNKIIEEVEEWKKKEL